MNFRLLLFMVIVMVASSNTLSIFYCGFSGAFCGQSSTNDVNPQADIVVLAFANILPNGSVIVDDANFPTRLVSTWKKSGKRVLLGVGGHSGNWSFALATNASATRFANSLADAVRRYSLDGVDLDLEYYSATPRRVANTIIALKNALGNRLLVVTPQCVTVYQGVGVPSADVGGNPFNYFVPIINLADQYIDLYQIQAYNNWYGGFPGGSLNYLKHVYLNWRNFQGLEPTFGPIPNFNGVDGNKILMGVLASPSAGGSQFYMTASAIEQFKEWISSINQPLEGFMMWDSYWDALNNFTVSRAVKS